MSIPPEHRAEISEEELKELQAERNQLRAALRNIQNYPANGNSDPDVMAAALDFIQKIAGQALVPNTQTLFPFTVITLDEDQRDRSQNA